MNVSRGELALGPRFGVPRRVDAGVESEIERLSALAPLHHPAALAWIRACRDEFGDGVEQVAVFDTAFHAGMPAAAASYALPHALAERHGLRRYGFHGIAHRALWSRWCALRPDLPEGGRLVTLQLGAGCSACAIERGRSVDTSMGYSPLEGLMMATRCGDIDPALPIALQREAGLAPAEVERLLATQSGLLGVSGLSADMRVLLASDDARSRLAVEMFCHRARKVLGGYLAVLHGADGIVFGGGIGENAPAVREHILDGFEWAGLALDAAANAACVGREACISRPDSRIQAWVVPVDEAHELAGGLGDAAGIVSARGQRALLGVRLVADLARVGDQLSTLLAQFDRLHLAPLVGERTQGKPRDALPAVGNRGSWATRLLLGAGTAGGVTGSP